MVPRATEAPLLGKTKTGNTLRLPTIGASLFFQAILSRVPLIANSTASAP